MIGMSQIRKRFLIGLAIGVGVGVIGIILTIVISNSIVKSYEAGTNEKFLADYTRFVVTFNRDVIQGEKISSDMISMQRVHINTVPSSAFSATNSQVQTSVIGMIAKFNIPKGTTVTNNMLGTSIVENSTRLQEINAVVMPSDLVENEYIDVRLKVPSGIDYIVLAQKQVLKIMDTTIWIELTEEELLLLNSAIVDTYLNNGTELYAVKYADPTTQVKIGGADAIASARAYLVSKINDDVSKMEKVTVQVPTTTEVTGEVGTTTTTTTTTETRVTTTSEILVDLIATYADEYKYYVESFNKVESNYQPNSQVMSFMQSNKYITTLAKQKLNANIRVGIEAGIAAFENSHVDDYNTLVDKLNQSITTQQSLRSSVLKDENQ